jgi:regulation of enolase protein 1 (concanavalin A-like superfamily)
MDAEIKLNLTKDEIEITVNVVLVKHPEHNTTDVVIEFPNGNKFITTVINREYEDEQRAQIGRTIHNIVYRQLKIEKALLTQYIYEKGLLLTHKGPPKSHYQEAEKE